MLDDNNEERRTISESYTSAVSLGNSRVEPHRTTQADLIVAAGMNRNRMGMALMRLASEWNSGAVPKPVDSPDVKALAREIADHRFEEWRRDQPRLTRAEAAELREKNAITKSDIERAHQEARELQARSVDWNAEENKLRFQRLTTLPSVRAGLVYWVNELGWEGAEHIVAAVLRHFLSPNCPACNGSGLQMKPGTLGREAKQPCRECRDKKVRGKCNVPHGGRGRKLLDHLQTCIGTAVRDLREGAYRLRRDELSEEDRKDQRADEVAVNLRRAGAEARRDEKSDPARIAAIAGRLGQRPVLDRLIRQIADYRDAHDKQAPAQLVVTRNDLLELFHDRRLPKYGMVLLVGDAPGGSIMGVKLVCEN